MNHPIVVSSTGITGKQSPFYGGPLTAQALNQLYLQLQSVSLKQQKYYMNEADYQDILCWSKGNSQ